MKGINLNFLILRILTYTHSIGPIITDLSYIRGDALNMRGINSDAIRKTSQFILECKVSS